jgi:hypothetical protein
MTYIDFGLVRTLFASADPAARLTVTIFYNVQLCTLQDIPHTGSDIRA